MIGDCYHGLAVVFHQADGTVKCSKCGQSWEDGPAYFRDMESLSETPESVHEWCVANWPNEQNPQDLALYILEEAIELCRAVGVEKSEIALKTLDTSGKRVSEPPAGELADIAINVICFAKNQKLNVAQEVSKKMKLNRGRYNAQITEASQG